MVSGTGDKSKQEIANESGYYTFFPSRPRYVKKAMVGSFAYDLGNMGKHFGKPYTEIFRSIADRAGIDINLPFEVIFHDGMKVGKFEWMEPGEEFDTALTASNIYVMPAGATSLKRAEGSKQMLVKFPSARKDLGSANTSVEYYSR